MPLAAVPGTGAGPWGCSWSPRVKSVRNPESVRNPNMTSASHIPCRLQKETEAVSQTGKASSPVDQALGNNESSYYRDFEDISQI